MKGHELKQWRKSAGLTQSELAAKLEVSRATVVNNEMSREEITTRLDRKVAELRRTTGLAKIQEGLADMMPVTKGDDQCSNQS